MTASLYLKYPLRSLQRGGQHTLLAIFCIAVGVMAIVSLQLVGLLITNAYTNNVRDLNGGDISVSTQQQNVAFKLGDMNFFDQLKRAGTITAYTPVVNALASLGNSLAYQHHFTVEAVDPNTFPVVPSPAFTAPANATLSNLLGNHRVVVSQMFVDTYNKRIGDAVDIYTVTHSHGIRALHVQIAGIIPNAGLFSQAGSLMLVAANDFQAAAPNVPLPYDQVYVATADQAHTNIADSLIEGQFYYASTQTAPDLLKNNQMQADLVTKFLELVGILALLIGGIGIVNTMQVMLSRRKTEIAMLKTTGYRRLDLYLFFGLEAGLLGFLGGVIGALAAIGVSYLLLELLQQAFGQRFLIFASNVAFSVDWTTIGEGVAIGFATSLIFGLMPIVQAANIRPLNVLRELPENKRVKNALSASGLLLLLSLLFCLLASSILKNVVWGIITVYGTFLFLAFLSIFISLIVLAISSFPVPERFNVKYLALIVSGIVLSGVLLPVLPAYGGLLLVLSLLGIVHVWFPTAWKSRTRMALRNLGRQRTRTTTTMLALFVGVFAIGLILIVGQDLNAALTATFNHSLAFNVQVISTGTETNLLQAGLGTIPGVSASQQTIFTSTQPLTINGTPLKEALPTGSNALPSTTSMGNANAVEHMSSLEGYDVTNTHFPTDHNVTITNGRGLNPGDLGTNHVIVGSRLVQQGPLYLKIGSTITLSSPDGKSSTTVTVVGAYNQGASDVIGDILAPTAIALSLSPADHVQTVHYLNIATAKYSVATAQIQQVAPNAVVYTIADLAATVGQLLSNIVLALTAVASLSMLAGVIIVANVVALSMLERRRELGILKSVGYTSRLVLGEVLMENGIVGATAALLALLFVLLAANLIGRFAFQLLSLASGFTVNAWYMVGLIIGTALLTMIVATLVAWQPVRVRPLEVLRYE